MADVFSKKKRSWVMSRIRSRGTKPERKLLEVLKSLGYKPKTQVASLPGTPDCALTGKKIAFFVHGCLWHAHKRCRRAKLPASNRAFWRKKQQTNARRDRRQTRKLRKAGWSVAVFWTCKKLTPERVKARIARIDNSR